MKQRKAFNPYPFNSQVNNPLIAESNQLDIFKGKTFLEFNEIIGLPVKNGKEHPIYDYELDVIDKIDKNRNVWIKKASGIGATELILRFLTWKILTSQELEYKNIFIISGTYVHHANDVKVRMGNLFRRKFPFMTLESKFTDLWIKNTNIKIFPSRNVKDLRGYTDVSYLFIDEADHFEPSVISELQHAITRYEEKSNCTTIMCSTPNRPDGLFESIEKDPHSKYYKIFLLVDVGLDKIFDRNEINKKRKEPEFPREYEGKYLGKIGNVFTPFQVDSCVNLGSELMKLPISQYNLHCVGVDFGFGSSKTAIVLTEHVKDNDKIIVRFAEEYDHADPQKIVNQLFDMHRNYMNTYFFVDGANRAMVNLMKVAFDESLDWESNDINPDDMKVLPVNFMTEHKNMLSHLMAIVSKRYLAIPEKYDKLIVSLRTAYSEELNLKKDQTSYDDLLDALRLSLKGYHIQ